LARLVALADDVEQPAAVFRSIRQPVVDALQIAALG